MTNISSFSDDLTRILNLADSDVRVKEIEETVVEDIQKKLTNGFDTSDIDKGKKLVIIQEISMITISTSENQKNENSSNYTSINLGECEMKIIDEYNIPKNKSLYILKIDVKQNGLKIPKIVYEVYYPLFDDKLIKLNLTVCSGTKIKLSIPVLLTEEIDIINPYSKFYNDICYTYTSDVGTDISLSDRKNNFVNNNLTVCEEDCKFNGYNYKIFKAICFCKTKINPMAKIRDIIFDKNKLYDSFTNFKNIANIKVLKCYKLIFNLDKYMHNYANFIMINIIIFFIVTTFIFYYKDYLLLEKIFNIIIYFKTNKKLQKKLLIRKKKEEDIKIKKENQILKTNDLNSEKKKEKKNQNLDKSSNITANPIKRIKRNIKIFNNNLITNNISSNNKETFKKMKSSFLSFKINENDYPYHMNENQIYELFLLINKKSDVELNDLDYNSAIKIDQRTYLEYYFSLLRTKHFLFFSFWPTFDYNSRTLKIFLFFFSFTLSFMINALFFNDDTMHKIYEEKGAFNFIYNIPQIVLSSIISGIIKVIIQSLALTNSNFINLKLKTDKNIAIKKQEILKSIKIKFVFYFIISFTLLIIFWLYLSCFCAVYKNTQMHLIKDTVLSFGTSMLTPLVIYIFPGIFRFIALKEKKKEYMFKFSKLLQML